MTQSLDLSPKSLYRSEDNNILLGVCAGLAERFNVAPWTIRLALVISIFFFGTGILFYLICAVCMPRKSQIKTAYQKKVLGVCLRLSKQLGVDVSLLRIATVLLGLASLGFVVLFYLLLYVILDDIAMNRTPKTPAER